MEVWRNVIGKHLGRKILRHVENLRIDITAVDVGIKPAYLFDIGQACGEKLINLLYDLKREELIEANLNVIEIGMDCLIVNVEEIKKMVNLMNLNERLIDVSKSLHVPCFCSSTHGTEDVKVSMKKVIEGLDSTKVKLSTLPLFSCNITSVFGLMLNYPLVYWFSDHDGKGDNCLSFEKLVSVKVTVRLSADRPKSVGLRNENHCLYSFSYPFCLQSVCELKLEQWYDKLNDRLQEQKVFSDVKMSCEEIVLEAVCL